MSQTRPPGKRTLIWIGVFKLVKGLLLVIVATGILGFVHKDAEAIVEHWVTALRFDPDNGHITSFLQAIGFLTDKQLKELSGLTFVYAAMFLTEGIGLLMRKRWAEYFTVIATGSLIPVELYETFKHFTLLKLLLIFVNVGIVWFLIWMLRKQASEGEVGAKGTDRDVS
jgi:uncharacterized membrane protein (DUF2068 family)